MEATSTLTTIEEYSQYFSELVELERKEEISRHMREIKSMSGEKREKAGRAILRMNGHDAGRGLGGSYLIKYGRQDGLPDHNLSVGDLVIVSSGKPSGQEPQGTILEKTNFSLTLAFTKLPPKFAYAKKLRIDLFANDIPYQRMLNALKKVKKHDALANFLLCERELSYQGQSVEQFQNTNLDVSQQETVQQAVKADHDLLVHGPPGTGKTTTLIETIQQHVIQNHAVLATADSNTAVDNMVEKLVARNVSVVRVGNPARMNKELLNHSLDYLLQFEEDFKEAKAMWEKIDEEKELQQHHTKPTGQSRRGLSDREIKQLAIKGGSKRGIQPKKIKAMAHWLKVQERIDEMVEEARYLEEQATQKLLNEAEVVCCTNSTAGSDVLEGYLFDTVVIDEATQAVEPSCLIPMLMGAKYIMAGDHRQLPPTVLNQEAEPFLQVSMFERLIAGYPSSFHAMLTIQYRMNEDIMAFSNRAFYDGALEAHSSVAHHTLEGLGFQAPKTPHMAEYLQRAVAPEPVGLFIDTGRQNAEYQLKGAFSYRNDIEADTVLPIANTLINGGLDDTQLGIISPYDSQVDLLKKHLRDHYPKLEIKTVDGFQGREKEVIIISFVRSNDKKQLGFLKDYRRLNVAVTRARRKLIMLGDAEHLSGNATYNEMIELTQVIGLK